MIYDNILITFSSHLDGRRSVLWRRLIVLNKIFENESLAFDDHEKVSNKIYWIVMTRKTIIDSMEIIHLMLNHNQTRQLIIQITKFFNFTLIFIISFNRLSVRLMIGKTSRSTRVILWNSCNLATWIKLTTTSVNKQKNFLCQLWSELLRQFVKQKSLQIRKVLKVDPESI